MPLMPLILEEVRLPTTRLSLVSCHSPALPIHSLKDGCF